MASETVTTSPAAHAGIDVHVTRVRPPSRWGGVRLAELWEYRELWYFLTKRELQVRYKQSFFGAGWAVLQPLALMAIFTIVFGNLVDIGSEGIPYPVFALSGLTVWLFISSGIAQAGASLVADSNLLSKVYFPRMTVPLAKVSALLIDLAVALVLLLVVTVVFVDVPGLAVLTLPLWLALAGLSTIGVGLLAATVNVRYRDVAVVIPLALQVGLFLTPIAYPASLVSGAWVYVYALNPAASAITGVRWALFGTPGPAPGAVAVSVAVAVAATVAAVLYFRRSEQQFADIV
jgi:lipopolysaccharide transport system permease protein